MPLSPAHRQTLSLICDTLLPSIAEANDPHGYWRRTASDLNVAPIVADHIAALPAAKDRNDLAQLIGMFDNAIANLLLCGQPTTFRALTPDAREQYLRAWANSRLPLKRQGFQALKRLAAFAYFTTLDAKGINPNWPALQYPGPVTPSPSKSKPISPLDHTTLLAQRSAVGGQPSLDCDVVVIGSGAGGGVIAAELARAGQAVIVVERGGYYAERDFTQREGEMSRALFYNAGSLVTKDSAILLLAGSCFGGGTTVNWNTSLRPPLPLRERWEREHGLAGVTGAAFDLSVDAVCERLSVGTGESVVNPQNNALRRGATALGYRAAVLPRNVNGCGDGDACGYCTLGCQRGAKQSTLVTYLPDAFAHGARFIVNAEAQKVLIENGRAVGVEVVLLPTGDGGRGTGDGVTIRARAVVVAGGSIGSPALLLRSGLTNPNIGRHLHLHPTSVVMGIYDDAMNPWHGPPQSIVCNQFADMDDGYGFVLETPPLHTGLPAAVMPWTGGRAFKADMLALQHTAAFIALVKDRDSGRVTINNAGQPLVDYRVSPYDRAHLVRGLQEAARVHIAAGAREVRSLHNQPVVWRRGHDIERFVAQIGRARYDPNTVMLGSAHQMGTCRMGRDARTAVADPFGQAHGVKGLWIGDASAFPTASGVNPMITIMALAHRTAGHIKESL
ncbi:MAG: GMC family oxidoreductase N-terminal domain-containing protein [Chloroflexota bacterium]